MNDAWQATSIKAIACLSWSPSMNGIVRNSIHDIEQEARRARR